MVMMGRHNANILSTGGGNSVSFSPDLTALPSEPGTMLIQDMAGDTWNWQYWYRDMQGGAMTSNFCDAISQMRGPHES